MTSLGPRMLLVSSVAVLLLDCFIFFSLDPGSSFVFPARRSDSDVDIEVVLPRAEGYSPALDGGESGPVPGEISLVEAAQLIVECASMRSERDETMMSLASLELSSGPSGPSNTLAESQLTSTQNAESVAAGLAAAAAVLEDGADGVTSPRRSRRSSRSPPVSRSNSNSPFFIRMNEGDDPPSPVYHPSGPSAALDDSSVIAISPPVAVNEQLQSIPPPPAVFQLPPYGPGPSQVMNTLTFSSLLLEYS